MPVRQANWCVAAAKPPFTDFPSKSILEQGCFARTRRHAIRRAHVLPLLSSYRRASSVENQQHPKPPSHTPEAVPVTLTTRDKALLNMSGQKGPLALSAPLSNTPPTSPDGPRGARVIHQDHGFNPRQATSPARGPFSTPMSPFNPHATTFTPESTDAPRALHESDNILTPPITYPQQLKHTSDFPADQQATTNHTIGRSPSIPTVVSPFDHWPPTPLHIPPTPATHNLDNTDNQLTPSPARAQALLSPHTPQSPHTPHSTAQTPTKTQNQTTPAPPPHRADHAHNNHTSTTDKQSYSTITQTPTKTRAPNTKAPNNNNSTTYS